MDAMSAPPWQRPTVAALADLAQRGVHAALVHGQAGTGKLLAAIAFARFLLCERPSALQACGTCTGCRLVQAANHPDLRIVVPDALAELVPMPSRPDDDMPAAEGAGEAGDGKSKRSREIRIEQVRQLGDLAEMSSHQSGRRVVVMAPAEALNAAAANAALKLLEEPPPRMMFVLCADALDDVLPTIRSRCVLVRAGRPTAAAALSWLQEQGVDDAEVRLAEAGGAPLAAMDQAGRASLDPESRNALMGMLRAGSQLSLARIVADVPRAVAVGPACAMMQRWAWDILALQHGAPVRYHPAERPILERLASMPADGWLHWWKELGGMRSSADHPLNPRLVVEAALIGYARAASGA